MSRATSQVIRTKINNQFYYKNWLILRNSLLDSQSYGKNFGLTGHSHSASESHCLKKYSIDPIPLSHPKWSSKHQVNGSNPDQKLPIDKMPWHCNSVYFVWSRNNSATSFKFLHFVIKQSLISKTKKTFCN